MSATSSAPLTDTSDMAWLHQVFRDALHSTVTLLGPIAPGDVARADVVGSYYDNVLRLLHGHHESEDELMTPKLLERLPDHAGAIARIGNQHDAVFTAVTDAETALATWRADPTRPNNVAFSRTMVALQLVLMPHLDEEEELIVPLAATCITAGEWAELPAHGMRAFTGDKPWLITGLVQEQMPPARIALMEANMPPPVLEFWTTQGRSLFETFIGALRG